ncbi:MAG: oxidoreductase, partial [Salinibacterium sp.]
MKHIELRSELDDDILPAGDVTVDVDYSSINFKDALAIGGRPGISRVEELIPGIDIVGTVTTSEDSDFRVGD